MTEGVVGLEELDAKDHTFLPNVGATKTLHGALSNVLNFKMMLLEEHDEKRARFHVANKTSKMGGCS